MVRNSSGASPAWFARAARTTSIEVISAEKGLQVLLIVLLMNAAIYLVMAATTGELSWDADTLQAWGGNLGELSLHGEPWRLLTATFLHAGLQHIIGNVVLLAMIGAYIEPWIGPALTTVTYMVSGIAGSVLSAFGHPEIVAVGASGSIAGLVGVLTAFYFGGNTLKVSGRWLTQIVGINAAYSFMPGVDALAHFGGFVAGAGFGAVLLLRPTRQMRLLEELASQPGVAKDGRA